MTKPARADLVGRQLAPATRSRAEIHHHCASAQQVLALVDFHELEGGP